MRSLIAALALCFAFPLGAQADRPALVDRIVAVVNKEAITDRKSTRLNSSHH